MNQLTPIQDRPAVRARVIEPAAGTPRSPDTAKRIIVTGILATIAMVTLLAASQLINYGAFDLRYGAFDVDSHASVFGVASLLAEIAAAAAIIWRGSRSDRHRWAWAALGVLVAALVLMRTLTTFNAKTLAAPLACVFLLTCWLTWQDRRAARTIVWAALILMVTSAFLHQVGLDADVTNYSNQSWAYQVTAVLKHASELAGWMLLVLGVIAGMEHRAERGVAPRELRLETDGVGR